MGSDITPAMIFLWHSILCSYNDRTLFTYATSKQATLETFVLCTVHCSTASQTTEEHIRSVEQTNFINWGES